MREILVKRNAVLFYILLSFLLTSPVHSYIIHSISIVSNTKTKNSIIEQELLFKKGDTYSTLELPAVISNSAQNIKNLGIFSEVKIGYIIISNSAADNAADCPVDVIVAAVDKWTLFPVPYYFYDNKTGHMIGFLIEEGNLFGLNQQLDLEGQYVTVPDFKDIEITYDYPRVSGSYYNFEVKLAYQDFLDSHYDNNTLDYLSRTVEWDFYTKADRVFPVSGSRWDIYGDITVNLITNKVGLNSINTVPVNRTLTYLGIGAGQGLINRDGGTVWGDDNYIWFGLSPLDSGWKTELQHSKFFAVFNKSVIGYRLRARLSPTEDSPLDLDSIRGIKLGDVRGNYIFYGNIDFRIYILTFDWPTKLEFFIPLFFDFGSGFRNGEAADISKTIYTIGAGVRFYPLELGDKDSAFRFDIGVNMPDLLSGESFENYIYIAFSFSEYF